MTPQRTFDPDAVRAVFRHESMGGLYAPGRMRIGEVVANPANYAFVGEHGAVVCVRFAGSRPVYNLCVGYLPDGRGAWGVAFLRACLGAMFEAGAERVVGLIPADRPASIGLGRAVGFGARIMRRRRHTTIIFAARAQANS